MPSEIITNRNKFFYRIPRIHNWHRRFFIIITVALTLFSAGQCFARPTVFDVNRASSYGSVNSDSKLDPGSGKNFLLAFVVSFDRLPAEGESYTILSKIDMDTPPHPGWAIAIQQLTTSLRFRVYWRDTFGKGGWFTFDRIEIVPRKWYAISLITSQADFLNLYLEPLSRPGQAFDQSGDDPPGQPRFLGGYSLRDIGVPVSDVSLRFGAVGTSRYSFRGGMAAILVGNPELSEFKSEQLLKFIAGGPVALRDKMERNQISLWIGPSGVDESRFSRGIEIVGTVAKRELAD